MESIIERNALQPVDHVRGAPRWPFRPGVVRFASVSVACFVSLG